MSESKRDARAGKFIVDMCKLYGIPADKCNRVSIDAIPGEVIRIEFVMIDAIDDLIVKPSIWDLIKGVDVQIKSDKDGE